MHASTAGVLHDWHEIGSLQGIAASQYEHRYFHGCDLVNQVESFGSGEFQRMALRAGIGPTVETIQVAGLSHLPDDQQRSQIEITRLKKFGL